jgi:hypothetical protein
MAVFLYPSSSHDVPGRRSYLGVEGLFPSQGVGRNFQRVCGGNQATGIGVNLLWGEPGSAIATIEISAVWFFGGLVCVMGGFRLDVDVAPRGLV